jgi:hypothetical protein
VSRWIIGATVWSQSLEIYSTGAGDGRIIESPLNVLP